MLEARMSTASTLKKVLEAIKELVTDANFDCNAEDGIQLQAMDNSHVALVAVKLDVAAFENFRCDRAIPLGINLASLTKVMKCAMDSDTMTIRADDAADLLNLKFETANADRLSEWDLKLMDIDTEHLGIPTTVYDAVIKMPSSEFARICRELSNLGESVRIEANKDSIKFIAEGDVGHGTIVLKPTSLKKAAVPESDSDSDEDVKPVVVKKEVKKEKSTADGDDDMEVESTATKTDGASKSKKRRIADDEDDEDDVKPDIKSDDDAEEEDEEDAPRAKKASSKNKASQKTKGKLSKTGTSEREVVGTSILLTQAVTLTFSLKYLSNFAKSTPLSDTVSLNLSNDVPLLVEYKFDNGSVAFYLAPKIGDE